MSLVSSIKKVGSDIIFGFKDGTSFSQRKGRISGLISPGDIGEVISGTTSSLGLTTSYQTLVTLNLTPGVWLLSANLHIISGLTLSDDIDFYWTPGSLNGRDIVSVLANGAIETLTLPPKVVTTTTSPTTTYEIYARNQTASRGSAASFFQAVRIA